MKKKIKSGTAAPAAAAETAAAAEHIIGSGMTRREAMQIRKRNMNEAELAYLRRKRIAEMVWPVFRTFILIGLCFIILYPLIYMISCAFRMQKDMNDPTVMWIPRNLTLSVIRDAAKAMDYWTTLRMTLLTNIGCSVVQVVSCAVTGYGFARFKFKFQKPLFFIVIMMIMVPPQILSISQFMFYRFFDLFGIVTLINGEPISLIDNPITMYLPALTANGIKAGLFIFLFRQFFKGLPKELEDAAYLDGCGPFKTFIRVMCPNASSSFLTVFLFSVVWYWNDYYVSSTFFYDQKTMALMLKNLDAQLNMILFTNSTIAPDIREKIVWLEAGCLISILPILLMYIFLQKYFTEGIERSGLVG